MFKTASNHIHNPTRLPMLICLAITFGLGILFMVGLATDPKTITGAPAWIKPFKFVVSILLYSATMVWMLPYIQTTPKNGWLLRGCTSTIAVALILELALIGLQAFRGVGSHFNVATPFDVVVFALMGLAISLAWLANVVIAAVLMLQKNLSNGLGWALRLGLVVAVLGMAQGFLMTAPTPGQLGNMRQGNIPNIIGAHTVGLPEAGPGLPVLGWSTVAGDLRVAHFFGMHAMQFLPLFALLLLRLPKLREHQRSGLVVVAACAYLGFFVLLVWQALRAESVIAPSQTTVFFAIGLMLVAFVAGAWIASVPQQNLARRPQ